MTFRPALEQCEDRVVPTVVIWNPKVGYGNSAATEVNWDVGQRGSQNHHLPGAGYDPVFAGEQVAIDDLGNPVYSSADCTNYGGTFNAVFVEPTYGGRITLSAPVTTGALKQAGGIIDQPGVQVPYAPTDITVEGGATLDNPLDPDGNYLYLSGMLPTSYWWTGGTLNSTSNLATLTVTGSETTGLLAPAGGGTVYLGSNISLVGGAVLTMAAGTIDLINDNTEIEVGENSGLVVDPGQGQDLVIGGNASNTNNKLFIQEGGWGIVEGGGSYIAEKGYFINAGTFTVDTGSYANFGGEVPRPPQQAVGGVWQTTGGGMYIGVGAELDAWWGVTIDNGGLYFQAMDPESPCYITAGTLKIRGGDVIAYDVAIGGEHVYGQLFVTGDVIWSGGTYHPYVASEHNDVSDLWHVTGTFTVRNDYSPELAPMAVDDQNTPVMPTPGSHWKIVEAEGGFGNNNLPSYNTGIWAVDPQGGATPWWKLRSV